MSHATPSAPPFYGLMAEFDSAQALMDAAVKVRSAGYTRADAYSPFPIHGLSEALGFKERLVAPIVFTAGMTGLIAGFGMQYVTSVHLLPLNIGGRPFNSWVSFIPVTFELTILFAALSAVIGMIALNGLPQPYHPVFNAARFHLASQSSFFLAIEATDPKFDAHATREFLSGLKPREVVQVEN